MWPDRVSNPGPPTYESGALPAALRGLAPEVNNHRLCNLKFTSKGECVLFNGNVQASTEPGKGHASFIF